VRASWVYNYIHRLEVTLAFLKLRFTDSSDRYCTEGGFTDSYSYRNLSKSWLVCRRNFKGEINYGMNPNAFKITPIYFLGFLVELV
jgi:hypothetical protein